MSGYAREFLASFLTDGKDELVGQEVHDGLIVGSGETDVGDTAVFAIDFLWEEFSHDRNAHTDGKQGFGNVGRGFGDRAAENQFDGIGSQSLGCRGAIHRDVAVANDDDPVSFLGGCIPSGVLQVIECMDDAVKAFAGQIERFGFPESGTDEDGIELFCQPVEVACGNGRVVPEFNTQFFNLGEIEVDDFLWQPKARDAKGEHAAGLGRLLENRDMAALLCQNAGAGQ